MKNFAVTALVFIFALGWLPHAYGQDAANSIECTAVIHKEVGRLHRIFRAVVFGHRDALSAPVGYVTYEVDGSAWYKVSEIAWRSADKGFENTTHFNNTVDSRSEIAQALGNANRVGILETKNATTSELIPYIGTSMRALQCQLYQLCDRVHKSKPFTEEDAPQSIEAIYYGCVPIQTTSIAECHINTEESRVEASTIYHNCEDAVESILQHEAEVVNLAVQYDAAYRTLLQLSGSLDLFLQEIHWPISHTLRDTTDLITVLGRIPCFVASCDAYPPPKE